MRTSCLIGACVLAALVTACLWLAARAWPVEQEFVPRERGKFDAAEWAWLAGPRRPISERMGMLEDLRNRHLKPGLRSDQVWELLGAPDERGEPENRQWRYVVAVQRRWEFDEYAYLVVRFDPGMAVEAIELVE